MGLTSTIVTQLAHKCPDFGEITQNHGHYAIQCHSKSLFWYQWKGHNTTSYVSNSNLPPIWHHFYWSNFPPQRGCLSLLHSLGSPTFGMGKYGLKKLETSFYSMVLSIYRYLEAFKHDSRVIHECDRLAHRICRASLCCTAQPIISYFTVSLLVHCIRIRNAQMWQKTNTNLLLTYRVCHCVD